MDPTDIPSPVLEEYPSDSYPSSPHEDPISSVPLPEISLPPSSSAGQITSSRVPSDDAAAFGTTAASNQHRDLVISKVEGMIQEVVNGIIDDTPKLILRLSVRRSVEVVSQEDSSTPTSSAACRFKEISFPGSNPHEAWRFAVVMRILELMHEALVKGLIITKRDMFYKDPKLFIRQGVVDQYVDDIACTFGVQRHCLNVVAAAKGLVVGPLKITKSNGSILDFSAEGEGTLVPNNQDIQSVDMSDVRWILIVEKEATFRSLAGGKFWKDLFIGSGLLITGKGYPDISTRAFLRLLSARTPILEAQRPPIYALVDFDPDGIGVLSTYKHGSMSLPHENAHLRVPSLHWLGVRSTAVLSADAGGDGRGLLPMSSRDRRKARALLNKAAFQEDVEDTEWRRELHIMLMLNVKAEIQSLSDLDGGLEGWLGREITTRFLAGR